MLDALLGLARQPADTESAAVPEPSQLVLGCPCRTVDADSGLASAPCCPTRRLLHILDQGLRRQPRALPYFFDRPLRSPSPLAHRGPPFRLGRAEPKTTIR